MAKLNFCENVTRAYANIEKNGISKLSWFYILNFERHELKLEGMLSIKIYLHLCINIIYSILQNVIAQIYAQWLTAYTLTDDVT
jgi:hypothetical protein